MYKTLANRYLSFWNSKLPPLLVIIYYILSQSIITGYGFSFHILLFLLSSFGFGVLGYVVNDIADRKENHLQGRVNFMSAVSSIQQYLILFIALLIAVLPWNFIYFDRYVAALLLTQIIAYFTYSFPPFRFKERSFLGLIIDALYAHTIPAILVAYSFFRIYSTQVQFSNFQLILLFLFFTFTGLRNILIHQIRDFDVDLIAGTKTFATNYGIRKSTQIKSYFLVPVEVICFLLIGYLLPGLFPLLILFLLYVVYVFFRESSYLRQKLNQGAIDYKKYDFISDILLSEFYQKWLPVLFILLAPFPIHFKLALLLFHCILFAYNTYHFYFDLQFIYTVVLMQLKYAVWFIYHHLFLRVFLKLYFNTKHVFYWYILVPIKKVISK